MKYRRLSIFCTACFLVWIWIGMSNMDYRIGDRTYGMTTAAYFYIGLPILGVLGFFSTIPFELLLRRYGHWAGWLVAVGFYSIVIGLAYSFATPNARMDWALGVDASDKVELQRLVERDSFNDGYTVWGVCKATPSFVDHVVKKNKLTPTFNSNDFRMALGMGNLPEQELGFRGRLMKLYYHKPDSLLYFSRRGSEPTP